jgi:hypothetical protein
MAATRPTFLFACYNILAPSLQGIKEFLNGFSRSLFTYFAAYAYMKNNLNHKSLEIGSEK